MKSKVNPFLFYVSVIKLCVIAAFFIIVAPINWPNYEMIGWNVSLGFILLMGIGFTLFVLAAMTISTSISLLVAKSRLRESPDSATEELVPEEVNTLLVSRSSVAQALVKKTSYPAAEVRKVTRPSLSRRSPITPVARNEVSDISKA